jgi:hypothetical protein
MAAQAFWVTMHIINFVSWENDLTLLPHSEADLVASAVDSEPNEELPAWTNTRRIDNWDVFEVRCSLIKAFYSLHTGTSSRGSGLLCHRFKEDEESSRVSSGISKWISVSCFSWEA